MQQRATADEMMWNLSPSFVLSMHPVDSGTHLNVGPWQGTSVGLCEIETEAGGKVNPMNCDGLWNYL